MSFLDYIAGAYFQPQGVTTNVIPELIVPIEFLQKVNNSHTHHIVSEDNLSRSGSFVT